MLLRIRVKGLNKLIKDLERTRRELPRRTEKFVRTLGEEIVELAKREIGTNTKISRYIVAKRPRTGGGKIRMELGWKLHYGPILEWGPEKIHWVIRPRNKKALRFKIGGQTFFAKKVVRTWSAKSLRKHFEPAIEKALKNIGKMAKKVIIERG